MKLQNFFKLADPSPRRKQLSEVELPSFAAAKDEQAAAKVLFFFIQLFSLSGAIWLDFM